MRHITEELIKAAKSAAEDNTSLNGSKRTFDSERDAADFFSRASTSVIDIDIWNKCGSASDYALFDRSGQSVAGPIENGVFIRIHLAATGKYDWVRVINVQRDTSEVVITVKPSFDPTRQPADPAVISHFFSEESTNNFCLLLDGKSVSFYVIGIGEKQNTDHSGGLVETVRNAATANLGYYLGIQKAEWKQFCRTFLEIAGQ
jgi:hypothetical protein